MNKLFDERSSYKMGDVYAKALSKGLAHISSEAVNLCDNRLTEKGSLSLIATLKPVVRFLDLSYNIIGPRVAIKLGEYGKFKAIRFAS